MHPLASLAVASFAAFAVGQSPLTTLFTGGNGGNVGGGVYFDLAVTNPAGITILQIDVNSTTAASTPGTLDVLTLSGTRTGNQGNLSAWTGPSSLGNPLTTGGVGVPAPCALTTPLHLPQGSHGMALRANSFAHAYTNGNTTNMVHTNADVTLTAGEASNIAFTTPFFSPRVVNCRIHYVVGTPGASFAVATPYGAGCGMAFRSFYELFPTSVAFDLANTSLGMLFTGSGYIVLGGLTNYVPPPATATVLPLGNDTEHLVTLSASMPVAGGSAPNLVVCSNGYVSVTTGNGIVPAPSVGGLLNAPHTAFWSWHDYNPGPTTGQVKFHEAAGYAYVTWDGVWDNGGSSITNANTMQFQFHLATGAVYMVWRTMSGLGNGHLVGYSPGGASFDPGNADLTTALQNTIQIGPIDRYGLALSASARPLINTTIDLHVDNITPATAFGGIALGLQRFTPAVSLGGLGMTDCFQHHDVLATQLYVPSGLTTIVRPFTVPNLIGLVVQAQAYNYDPVAAITPLGAVSSRGLQIVCGDW